MTSDEETEEVDDLVIDQEQMQVNLQKDLNTINSAKNGLTFKKAENSDNYKKPEGGKHDKEWYSQIDQKDDEKKIV